MTIEQHISELKTQLRELDTQLWQLDKISHALDEAFHIPGTRIKIGWDALIGLIPIAGDIAGALMSLYFIWQGIQLNVPRWMLIRMGTNILIETLIGLIPVLGDIFDTQWHANRRNFHILKGHLTQRAEAIQKQLKIEYESLNPPEDKTNTTPTSATASFFWMWCCLTLIVSIFLGVWLITHYLPQS